MPVKIREIDGVSKLEKIRQYNQKQYIETITIITKQFGVLKLQTIKKLTKCGYIRQFIIECPQCHTKRWVKSHNLHKMKSMLCLSCSGSNKIQKHNTSRKIKYGKDSHLWKNGFTYKDGYKILNLSPLDPFISMADKYRRIREHRYIMAKHLGRLLDPWEIVHHKNSDRSDNSIENLELVTEPGHNLFTKMHNYITELESQIVILKEQLNAGSIKEVA